MGRTPMGSRNVNRLRPLAQVASVLVLVAAVNVYVRLRSEPASPLPPPAASASSSRDGSRAAGRGACPCCGGRDPSRRRRTRSRSPRRPRLPWIAPRWPGPRPRSTRPAAIEPAPRPVPTRPRGSSRQPSIRPRSTRPWRKLSLRIRDPSTQITQVAARGGFIRADLAEAQGRDRRAAEPAPAQGDLDSHQEPGRAAHVERRVSLRAPPRPDQLHRPRAAARAGQGGCPGPDPDVRPVRD